MSDASSINSAIGLAALEICVEFFDTLEKIKECGILARPTDTSSGDLLNMCR